MKHYVLASHGGFSKGIYESIQIIIGEQPNIHIVQAFVDGNVPLRYQQQIAA